MVGMLSVGTLTEAHIIDCDGKQDRKTTPWLWLSAVTMVGGCCVVVLVLVVNHTLWLCLCGGVGCGDHEW